MSDLIQKLFRKKLTEAASHTPSNPYDVVEKRKVTQKDLDNVTYTVQQYKNKYSDNPLFNNAIEGKGVYLVLISKNGNIHPNNIKTPNYKFDSSDIGNPRSTAHDNIQILIKATGIDGLTGAAVARIKTYVIFGDYIIEKVRTQTQDSYLTKDKDIEQKDLTGAFKKARKDDLLQRREIGKSNVNKLSPQEEKIALMQYAKEHNISVLDIDFKLKNDILRNYSKSKNESVSRLKQQLIEYHSKETNLLLSLKSELAKAAQVPYNAWDQDEEGCDVMLGSGGICQDIAEAMCNVLTRHDIECTSVSQEIGEQHVYAVAKTDDGVWIVDISPYSYETGGGYCWKKIPDVQFDESYIIIDRISSDPEDFNNYLEY